MKFSQSVLDNGLTVATDHLPEAKGVSVHWVLRAGARHDEIPGTAHFFEHLFSSGLDEKGQEAALRFEDIGQDSNFLTGRESISAYVNVLPEFVPEVVRTLGRIIVKRTWTDEAFAEQRQLILDEASEAEASSWRVVYKAVLRAFYAGHPLAGTTIGTPETIQSITEEDIENYRRNHFLAGDMAVVVSGPIFHDDVVHLVAENFGNIPAGKNFLQVAPVKPDYVPNEIIIRPREEELVTLFSESDVSGHKNVLPTVTMNVLLGKGLHRFLRNGHSYSGIDSCMNVPFSDHGNNGIRYYIMPEKAEKSLRAVAGFIGSPQSWLTEENFEKFRLKDRTSDAFSFFDPAVRASSLAIYFQEFGKVISFEEKMRLYEDVTFEDVLDAYKIFKSRRQVVFGCGPCEVLPSQDEINDLIQGRGSVLQAALEIDGPG